MPEHALTAMFNCTRRRLPSAAARCTPCSCSRPFACGRDRDSRRDEPIKQNAEGERQREGRKLQAETPGVPKEGI